MSRVPVFDFSGLTTAERIELAEQLWDSIPADSVEPTSAQMEELRLRRAELAQDQDPGQPWEAVLDEIEAQGG